MNQINELFAELDAAPKIEREVVVQDDTGETRPFSALRIGNNTYQIADGETEGSLMFRVDEYHGWVCLEHTLEHGWQKIGAEILMATRDAIHDYAKMHTIKMPMPSDDPEHFSYDLFEFQWEMKAFPAENRVSLNIPDRGWVAYTDIDVESFGSRRAASIYALVHAAPELVDNFRADVEAWATRLAAGATVEPI